MEGVVFWPFAAVPSSIAGKSQTTHNLALSVITDPRSVKPVRGPKRPIGLGKEIRLRTESARRETYQYESPLNFEEVRSIPTSRSLLIVQNGFHAERL